VAGKERSGLLVGKKGACIKWKGSGSTPSKETRGESIKVPAVILNVLRIGDRGGSQRRVLQARPEVTNSRGLESKGDRGGERAGMLQEAVLLELLINTISSAP